MKKLIVFDLDGTLVDSIGDIAAAVNRSLVQLGLRTHPVASYYKMVGDGMELLCRRALGDENAAQLERLIALYRADYLKNCCEKTKPYPGILALLERIKESGAMTAIISNKPQEQTQRVVAEILGTEKFDRVFGKRAEYPKKPDPAVFFALLKEVGVKRDDTLYVGDSDVDIEFGRRAGVDTVGASWGFRGAAELIAAKAPCVVDDAAALSDVIFC